MQKNPKKQQQQPIMLQQYLISIAARLRSRNSTVSEAEIYIHTASGNFLVGDLQEIIKYSEK